jgi:hypothetical protein
MSVRERLRAVLGGEPSDTRPVAADADTERERRARQRARQLQASREARRSDVAGVSAGRQPETDAREADSQTLPDRLRRARDIAAARARRLAAASTDPETLDGRGERSPTDRVRERSHMAPIVDAEQAPMSDETPTVLADLASATPPKGMAGGLYGRDPAGEPEDTAGSLEALAAFGRVEENDTDTNEASQLESFVAFGGERR